MKKKSKAVRYNKWGYIFLLPFIIVYVIFQLIPMVTTIYNSFFENYLSGLTQIGPNFVGLANYQKLFSDGDIWVGTRSGGLYIYDAKLEIQKKKFHHDINTYAVCEDNEGNLWIATRGEGVWIGDVKYRYLRKIRTPES